MAPLRLCVEALCSLWMLWPLLILCSVFVQRVGYPIDLEWCEGGSLYQAQRLLQGLPIYSKDDPYWAPFPYPPAHTLLLASVGWLHLDFSTGRLISIGFFLLLCWAVFQQVYAHGSRSAFGVAAAAFAVASIACGFPIVGQFYDLVRVDTMMIALTVWGVSRVDEASVSIRGSGAACPTLHAFAW
ncbi:MAG TPA: hypothetical protein VKP30_01265 [Polyangiaceae bacterium]|nr:hypothetical protein [Polyangiaceae bacterium]